LSLAWFLFSWQAGASERFPNKTFGLDAVAGFPQFAGLEVSYLGWTSWVPGLSFGSAPINGLLNSKINVDPVLIQPSAGSNFLLSPSAEYSLYSFSFSLKYFFEKSGFFLNFIYSNINFGAKIRGDLTNVDTGGVSRSAVTGNATLNQSILGLGAGYQVIIYQSLFAEFALGAGYLFPPHYSVSMGGTAVNVAALIPNGEQSLEDAKKQVQTAFDSAVGSYQASVKILPFAFINLGFAF
jgi:hypothetical protein